MFRKYRYKYQLNQEYQYLENELVDIKTIFHDSSESIHKARNELKIVEINGIDSVVKAFKVPNIINQIVYSFFRDSKAKKSYEYSLKIDKFTPKPIAYIEYYTFCLLKKSFFINLNFKYDFTIREPLLDKNFEDRDNILKGFAKFTLELHNEGIFHNDYSPGNVLIKKEDDTYIFKIVDINRMEFKKLSLEERLKNFKMLWAKDEDMITIVKEYARLMEENEDYCIKIAIKYSQKNKNFKNFKKRLKGKKVVD